MVMRTRLAAIGCANAPIVKGRFFASSDNVIAAHSMTRARRAVSRREQSNWREQKIASRPATICRRGFQRFLAYRSGAMTRSATRVRLSLASYASADNSQSATARTQIARMNRSAVSSLFFCRFVMSIAPIDEFHELIRKTGKSTLWCMTSPRPPQPLIGLLSSRGSSEAWKTVSYLLRLSWFLQRIYAQNAGFDKTARNNPIIF
jgi:hypothetical protein